MVNLRNIQLMFHLCRDVVFQIHFGWMVFAAVHFLMDRTAGVCYALESTDFCGEVFSCSPGIILKCYTLSHIMHIPTSTLTTGTCDAIFMA